jgi:hypothetical protein
MLTTLPRLFHPDHILSHQTIERFDELAQQQLRRVYWGIAAITAVGLASVIPALQDAGPLLMLAAAAMPDTFGPVIAWAEAPSKPWELYTGMGILGVAGLILGWEVWKLRSFRALVKPMEMSAFERKIFDDEGDTPQDSVRYLRAVEAKRPLRLGDWKLSLALLHREFPHLRN